MIFAVLLLVLVLLSLNENKQKKDIPSFAYWAIITILILLAGFRGGAGADDLVYKEEFYKISSSTKIGDINFEPGFALLMMLFRFLNLPFWLFCLLISILSILTKSICFSKIFPDKKYSILLGYFLLFYFNVEFAQIRLGLSMGLCLLATVFLLGKDKNPIIYHLIVLLACSIQITAIAFLPLYLLVNSKYRKQSFVFLMTILFIMAFCDLHSILYWINENILHSEYLYIKIVEYLDSLPLLNISLFIRIITILFCCGTFYISHNEITEFQKKLVILYIFGIGLYFGLRQVAILSIRMASFFRIYELPLLVDAGITIRKVDKKPVRICMYAFIILLGVYYVISFFMDMRANNLIMFIPNV